jgi:exodeoxyribonuclease VII large subunit
MGRLPFDPSKMAAGAAARAGAGGAPAGETPLTVVQLAERIDVALRGATPVAVRVVGEVSNFTDRTHWYFDLKDASAVVSCVMFASAARRCRFALASGMQVIARGRVEYYAKGGRVSFIVDALEPVGAGPLEVALRKLLEEVRSLGWLDPDRKRTLPMMPRRVAVVTSRTGAAFHDVRDTLARRCPGVEVLLVDVRVQGEGAPAEIVRALREVGRRAEELRVDVIILTRGGGSVEDLWAFNDKEVARAVVECPVPVVAAIGHETDTTIAELVADERGATPTQAAMRVAPDRGALLRQVESTQRRLIGAAARTVERSWVRVDETVGGAGRGIAARVAGWRGVLLRLEGRLAGARPGEVVTRMRERHAVLARDLSRAVRERLSRASVAGVEARLHAAQRTVLTDAALRSDAIERQLHGVGPLRVLERGYSITRREDGGVVRSAGEVRAGERVRTRVADGEFGSVVEGGGKGEGAAPAPPVSRPERLERPTRASLARRSGRGAEGPGLFG